jgi:hypothetical protein
MSEKIALNKEENALYQHLDPTYRGIFSNYKYNYYFWSSYV